MVERKDRTLGDALRTIILGGDQSEWDLLLPQIMRAFRGTPHSATGETANFIMLGREARLPDQLVQPLPPTETLVQYAVNLDKRLRQAH